MSLDFVVRDYLPTDRAFVADSWVNTLRAATEESARSDWQTFRQEKNTIVDRILDDPRTKVLVAAPKADELTIYGYLVGRPETVLHMLFVKKAFRLQGVAKRLLAHAGVELGGATCTQWTRDLGEWILKKSQKPDGRDRFGKPHLSGGLKYNPWEASP